MPETNGVSVRAVSTTFEEDFREFNGRSPTPDETRKHLAFDRLAKTSSLDPATLLLIVDAGRRNDERMRRASAPVISSPLRDIIAFTLAVLVCIAIGVVAGGMRPQPFLVLLGAFALGLVAALAYIWAVPLMARRR